jgi:hypothetical protein
MSLLTTLYLGWALASAPNKKENLHAIRKKHCQGGLTTGRQLLDHLLQPAKLHRGDDISNINGEKTRQRQKHAAIAVHK